VSADLGPYARLYLCIVDDEKFAAIYDDDRHFATYCRLLMIAEGAWPASAHLPATARPTSVKALADARIIDPQPGSRYRIHGLDAERVRRSEHGRHASKARWDARSNAPSNAGASAPSNARRDETSRDETSMAREGLAAISKNVADRWEQATGRTVLASGKFAQEYIDDACRRHPEPRVLNGITSARAMFATIPTPQQLASALRQILDPLPDAKQAVKAERAAEEQRSSVRRVEATIATLHYAHSTPDPRCPKCKESAA
jgi:hypothetical protein